MRTHVWGWIVALALCGCGGDMPLPDSETATTTPPAAAASSPGKKTPDAELLDYLKRNKPTREQQARAERLAAAARVISITYRRAKPVRDGDDLKAVTAFADTFRPVVVYPVVLDHHEEDARYPGLQFAFARHLCKDATPAQWLQHMRRPTGSGFVPERVSIVHEPPPAVARRLAPLCDTAAQAIVKDLQGMQRDLPPLKNFSDEAYQRRRREEPNSLGSVFYSYGLGKEIPGTKGGREKLAAEWCTIHITFAKHEGDMSALIPTGRRLFPHLGLEVRWTVGAEDKEFIKTVSSVIERALAPLVQYEQEISLQRNE